MTAPVQPAPGKPAPSKGAKIAGGIIAVLVAIGCAFGAHAIFSSPSKPDPTIASMVCENAVKPKVASPVTFSNESYTTKGSTWNYVGNLKAAGADGVFTCTLHWDGTGFTVTASDAVTD